MNDKAINERAQHLLKVLVERYIRDGQPVGSRTLADNAAISLSPASIRNIMAELEELGYVRSPHTSAGRIPTAQGYRFFVDSLLTVKPLASDEVQQLQQQLNPDQNVQGLVASASSLLSDITRFAGLVTMPRQENIMLRHVEFLPLSANRVLVILVFNEKEVQNRIIYTDRQYTNAELQQAANFLNEIYAGNELLNIRKQVLTAMQNDRQTMNHLMQAAIEMANKAFEEPQQKSDYVMAGQTNLLDLADAGGVERLRVLFEAFNQKRDILHLLDQCLTTDGVQIYIGEESGYQPLDECSVITAPYTLQGEVIGVLGVIGPTRMPYERVIPVVDVTAKLLSAALNHSR